MGISMNEMVAIAEHWQAMQEDEDAKAKRVQAMQLDKLRGHALLPVEVAQALPGFYATDVENNGQGLEAQVLLKVFDPCGRFAAYATELDPESGTCFGYVVSPLGEDCDELGYWNLWEVGCTRNRMGLHMERDCLWKPCTLREVRDGEKR